ncbi:PAS domain-containing protein [Sphingomonas sp. 1P06PA]|uniref:PAS domain-containing protein n=1 Tax=Sphingomonas sp. 1P06PA TaxID=554121 RepID=UPI0039A46C0C
MGQALSVSSAEFVRRFGTWQEQISADPLFVTHHGRRRLVMLSAASYDRLVDAAPAPDDDDSALAVRHDILLDQLDAGLVAVDGDLRVVQLNAAAASYFRISRDAAIGRPIDAHCRDLAESVARGHLARALSAGEVAQVDLPSISHPGGWLRVRSFPYGDGAACLFRSIGAEHEMHRIAEVETALRATLAAEGEIGIGQLTLRATFCDVDPALAGLAGFVRASLLQVRLVDILPLGRRVAAAAAIEGVLTGGPAVAWDSALLVNNGGERAVRIAAAPLRSSFAIDGAMVAVVGR